MRLMDKIRARMPTREQIAANRWLGWLGPWLHQTKLWHWSRRGVALGVALGVFFGLLIPVAQIPLSVASAVVLRANIPAAALSTLVTNPLTFGPIYYGAYQLGAWVTGSKESPNSLAQATTDGDPDIGFLERITQVGKPLLVGLSITAVLMGLLTYGLITLVWRWRTVSKRRDRMRRTEP